MIDKLTTQLEYYKRLSLEIEMLRSKILHSRTPLDAEHSNQAIDACDSLECHVQACILSITESLVKAEYLAE